MEALLPNHFRCIIPYEPLPPFHLLNGRYFDWASELFRPEMYKWEDRLGSPSESKPCECIFFLASFEQILDNDHIIRSLEKEYRPATLREALACSAPTPAEEIPCPCWISVLGTHTTYRGTSRIIPVIYRYDGGCDLAFDLYDRPREIGRRFLFIKK